MNLSSSKVFISVFLSAAPPRFFQPQPLEREVEVEPGCGRLSPQAKSRAQSRELTKDPEDFSSFILHQGVLTIPRLLLGMVHHHAFLTLSLCVSVKLFLKHHTSYRV
jgi:hypothetical protein